MRTIKKKAFINTCELAYMVSEIKEVRGPKEATVHAYSHV
jgi:hypothetical protein